MIFPTHWFKSEILQRLFKNAGILFTGNVISSILMLVSFALTARALSPEQFGILVIIQTYTRVIDRLFNFQSWQTLIKYGAEALEQNRMDDFRGLLKLGFFLDFSTAVIGTIVALLGSKLLSQWQGWETDILHMTWIYCIVIFFNITGTPTAILRLFNHFKFFPIQDITVSTIRLIVIAVAFRYRAPLFTYLIIYLSTDILAYIVLFYFGYLKLENTSFKQILHHPLQKGIKKFKGIIGFALTTNLTGTIRMLPRDGDILFIGVLLGEVAAGTFKIAKEFANIIIRFTDPLFYAIYPELAKLWAQKEVKNFVKLIIRSGLIGGGAAFISFLAFVLAGKFAITLTVGPQYLSAYNTMLIYMIASVIAVGVVPLSPAMLALGRYKTFLTAITFATVIYFALLPSLLVRYHIDGASIAYVIFYLIYTFVMTVRLNIYIKSARNP